MAIAVLVSLVVLLTASNVWTYVTAARRLRRQEQEVESRQFGLAEANVRLMDQHEALAEANARLEEQKLAMAEANLNLMAMREELEARSQELHEANARLAAQQERLEEQKLDLGEANLKLVEQNEIIEAERQHSEKLLLNILPQRVAAELKQRGATTPESFEDVTVFFSDVVDFTRLASELAPAVLIAELNDIFTHFDWIAKAHGCERIKTIGDAYLCVCGMPDPNPDNAMCVLEAAQEILAYLSERNRSSSHTWQIRIGIHSGSVVGGVVGVEKYIYDVFGDTINTAARMESWSSPMQINVSAATYERVKDRFRFIPRNPVEVKGKGLMSMYFLDPAGHLS